MKNILKGTLVFVTSLILLVSCHKEREEAFTIIGEWGMVSGTISDANGTTDRYDKHSSGAYYQLLKFRTDGTLIRTSMPDYLISYGVYTFNNVTNELSYKFDGNRYYFPATVQIVSADEMIITTDYGPNIGRSIQYFVRND